jgi:hypothetical protein
MRASAAIADVGSVSIDVAAGGLIAQFCGNVNNRIWAAGPRLFDRGDAHVLHKSRFLHQ